MSARVPWGAALVFVGETPAPGCPHANLGTALCPCTGSGRRLARLLGEPLERRCGALNLLAGAPWNAGWAEVEARSLRTRVQLRASFHWQRPEKYGPPPRFVLLGARVRDAFFWDSLHPAPPPFEWWDERGFRYLLLPHPSGRSREWNDPATRTRAQAALRAALGEPYDA